MNDIFFQIMWLEEDNVLMENKQKEVRETLDNVLKSRDAFIEVYEVFFITWFTANILLSIFFHIIKGEKHQL